MNDDLLRYRSEFPITERCTFLNHAAASAPPLRVADAMRAHIDRLPVESSISYYREMKNLEDETRQRIATLINARGADEIALMPNTGTGLNTAALSLPLQPGDNVLVLDGDYPSNVYPWQNLAYRGIFTKLVPQQQGGLDLRSLEQRIDSRTRVIALSSAMFATGFRTDIAAVGRLCHERGLFFVVDGIQTLGALPLDVQACHIDFLASGSHKWLLAARGSGFLYCRRELFDRLQPGAYVGADSVVDPLNFLDYNLTPPTNADRFGIGVTNWPGIVGLHAALSLLLEVGVERISQRILYLVAVLIDDLSERGYRFAASTAPEHRSGIVVAQVAEAAALWNRLMQAGLIVMPRGAGIRIAPHFYNTVEEVLRVGELLEAHGAQPA